MVEEDFMNERHVAAEDGLLQETTTVFDNEGQKMATTIAYGKCSICGKLDKGQMQLHECIRGDLVCASHIIMHNGIRYCRRHFESIVISKAEAMVLIGIAFLGKGRIKKFASMNERSVSMQKLRLEAKGCIEAKHLGLFGNSVKITQAGFSVLHTAYCVYINDNDFRVFIKNLSEVKPDWKEMLGITTSQIEQ